MRASCIISSFHPQQFWESESHGRKALGGFSTPIVSSRASRCTGQAHKLVTFSEAAEQCWTWLEAWGLSSCDWEEDRGSRPQAAPSLVTGASVSLRLLPLSLWLFHAPLSPISHSSFSTYLFSLPTSATVCQDILAFGHLVGFGPVWRSQQEIEGKQEEQKVRPQLLPLHLLVALTQVSLMLSYKPRFPASTPLQVLEAALSLREAGSSPV